jgi:ribosomal protein L25 (general stress protein Ctc)
MKIAFRRKKPEAGQILNERIEMTSADKRLDAFVKRVQEDMAKNKISHVEGDQLIIKTTLLINMLTRL